MRRVECTLVLATVLRMHCLHLPPDHGWLHARYSAQHTCTHARTHGPHLNLRAHSHPCPSILSSPFHAGMDLGGTKLAFDFRKLEQGMFYAGSFDGELVYADFVKPEGEENPDYAKSCLQVRARLWLLMKASCQRRVGESSLDHVTEAWMLVRGSERHA